MASMNSYLRFFAMVLFVLKLSDCYQSLQRVTERLDVVEETSQDLKEALRRESKYRREDVEAIYEVLKQLQGANTTSSVEDIQDHKDVNKSKYCTEEEITSKDNSVMLLLKAFKLEKQINAHLRNKLINIQNNLQEKIENLLENTVNKVAEEISTLLTLRDRLNDNVTVMVRGIEERLMSQLQQEKSSIWTKISEVNADLTAINESFIDEIGQCFEEISNQTKTLDNLSSKVIHKPTSCNQVMSKVHAFNLKEINQTVPVFCDVDTDVGGWIVFQRRKYGSEDFDRTWEDYKLGFGDMKSDFWWGNEKLHLMTRGQPRELRIDLEDFDGNKAFAKYSSFRILSEEHNYTLEVSGYSGTAGDALDYAGQDIWIHNGQAFSTRDRDNDRHLSNCAAVYQGGWWFNLCFAANLNGNYFEKGQTKDSWQGILWHSFRVKSSLKFAEMKFR